MAPEPIRVSYSAILDVVPKLFQEHKPDVVLHMGLDEGRTFFGIERSAPRTGYHQYPDLDRKVFTKADTKKLWGKSSEKLMTTLDRDDVLGRWQREFKKNSGVDVRVSDDVGDFVCGFIYYASLVAMKDRRDVVFLHVPPLKSGKEIEKGVEVTEALIKALAGSWLDGR